MNQFSCFPIFFLTQSLEEKNGKKLKKKKKEIKALNQVSIINELWRTPRENV